MSSQEFRKRPEYKEWQKQVKERDGYTCKKCDFQKNLHAHHIKPVYSHPELALDVSNGITLCGNCHSLLKNKENEIDIEKFIGGTLDHQEDEEDERIRPLIRALNGKNRFGLMLRLSASHEL